MQNKNQHYDPKQSVPLCRRGTDLLVPPDDPAWWANTLYRTPSGQYWLYHAGWDAGIRWEAHTPITVVQALRWLTEHHAAPATIAEVQHDAQHRETSHHQS